MNKTSCGGLFLVSFSLKFSKQQKLFYLLMQLYKRILLDLATIPSTFSKRQVVLSGFDNLI